MKVTFYGTRGSIPVSGDDYTEFGGNTSCVRITLDNGLVGILDAGTGIRKLGNDLLDEGFDQEYTLIGFSHTHIDHIQGLPFFKPIYDKKKRFKLGICGAENRDMTLHEIFATQTRDEYFPVSIDKMGSDIEFWEPDVRTYTTDAEIQISVVKHMHPGNAYSYRITHNSKTVVYCTDIEHGESINESIVQLSSGADLLIHDAQYTPEELKLKKGWGHSSWQQAAEVALRAGVKQLALFHHDPEHTDRILLNVEKDCQSVFSQAFCAREGVTVEI